MWARGPVLCGRDAWAEGVLACARRQPGAEDGGRRDGARLDTAGLKMSDLTRR